MTIRDDEGRIFLSHPRTHDGYFFLLTTFLAIPPMESISLNSFVLLEHLAVLLTSTHLKCKRGKVLNKAISINFAKNSKFYRRYYDLITKFQVGLKSL